jgi:hypothetical protein
MAWRIVATAEYAEWFRGQEPELQDDILAALKVLEDRGPALGRPLVEHIEHSRHQKMKELRVGTVRILFAFGPKRTGILLIAGDKERLWNKWYKRNVPIADRLFEEFEREEDTK